MPKPHSPIPIMIGGGGPKILALAAEEADIVGINPKIVGRKINPESMATTAADAMDEKIDAVRAAAGDRFDELELQVQIFKTVVTDQPAGGGRAARARRSASRPRSCSTRRSSRSARVEQITENIQAMRERWGISYVLFQTDGIVPMAPVGRAPRGDLTATSRRRHQIGGAAGRASVPIAGGALLDHLPVVLVGQDPEAVRSGSHRRPGSATSAASIVASTPAVVRATVGHRRGIASAPPAGCARSR